MAVASAVATTRQRYIDATVLLENPLALKKRVNGLERPLESDSLPIRQKNRGKACLRTRVSRR